MPVELPEAEDEEAATPDEADAALAQSRAEEFSPLIALILAGAYAYSRRRRTYTTSTGQPISRRVVRRELEAVKDGYKGELSSLGQGLISKGATLGTVKTWAIKTADELKALHLTSGAVARGGLPAMTPDDLRDIGRITLWQYDRLQNFANQVLEGTQKLDGRFEQRVEMYADASRQTFAEVEREVVTESGVLYERNILSPADHCAECVELSDQGWVDVGTLPAPGDRTCSVNCMCDLEYATAEEAA